MSGIAANETVGAPTALRRRRRWPRRRPPQQRSRRDERDGTRTPLERRDAAVALAKEAALVAGLTLACVGLVTQLWRADLSVPLRYVPVDDTKFYLMLVKGIIEHGSYLTNSTLGAPFGQQLFDYPQGADNLNLLLIRGLAVFSSNPAVVVNLFFLLTFVLVSVSAHLVMRRLGVGARAAGVAAVLFAVLPYHFFRGESHLLLSAYYSVPLAALLFLELLNGTRLAGARRRTLATVGLCVAIGSANLYYATFAVVLLAGATLIKAATKRWPSALDGLLTIVVITATLAVNLAPSLLYTAEHGSNHGIARTAQADETTTEAFALRVTNLVVPVPDDRIAPLRHLAANYDHAIAPGYCEACYASLGVVGTVGLGWLALAGFAALGGSGAGLGASVRAGPGAGTRLGARRLLPRRRLIPHAAAGVAIALAVGTVGGLSSLFEQLITPDIRAWNRISVFVAFFSFLALAVLLDSLIERLKNRRKRTAASAIVLAAVLAFGIYEQTTGQFVPAYGGTAREWRSDAAFVGQIEARLPRGASVFQLPYVPFPEGYPNTPVGDQVATYATKYEPLRGYLHSTTLRWSYGATKGRPSDWAAQLAGQPLALVVAAVTASGFDGLWVDPAGFEPAKARRINQALQRLLGQAPLTSPDRDLWFYDLRPYKARLERTYTPAQLAALRARTLHPPPTTCAPRHSYAPNALIPGLTGPPCRP